MKTTILDVSGSNAIGSKDDLLNIVASLAHKLALELDFHYEEEDSQALQEAVLILEAASAALLINGLVAPEVVSHAIGKFMIPFELH